MTSDRKTKVPGSISGFLFDICKPNWAAKQYSKRAESMNSWEFMQWMYGMIQNSMPPDSRETLSWSRNPGDGHCLYHALRHGLGWASSKTWSLQNTSPFLPLWELCGCADDWDLTWVNLGYPWLSNVCFSPFFLQRGNHILPEEWTYCRISKFQHRKTRVKSPCPVDIFGLLKLLTPRAVKLGQPRMGVSNSIGHA